MDKFTYSRATVFDAREAVGSDGNKNYAAEDGLPPRTALEFTSVTGETRARQWLRCRLTQRRLAYIVPHSTPIYRRNGALRKRQTASRSWRTLVWMDDEQVVVE